MSAAWERDPVGVWRLRVASDHHGMAWRPPYNQSDTNTVRPSIARVTLGPDIIVTTHPTIEAAKAWVEHELGISGRTT